MSNVAIHILIVEDNEQIGHIYENFLQHAGYRTLRLTKAQDAINHFLPFDPDIICLDWSLADGNCEPFLHYLSTLEAKNRPPLLLISAEAQMAQVEQYAHCITDFLPKPISMKNLLAKMEEMIPLANQRIRFENIHYKQLSPHAMYMQWIGNITLGLIRQKMHPNLMGMKMVVFDIRQMNTTRFNMNHEIPHPFLPNLEAIMVICSNEQHTFASFLMQYLTAGLSIRVSYHTDPERAVFEAMAYRG